MSDSAERSPEAPASASLAGAGGAYEQALAAWLVQQRWFGSKGRRIAAVRLEDSGTLAFGGQLLEVALGVVLVEFDDGGEERYCVPLATARGESVRPSDPGAVVVEDVSGIVFDALADARAAALVWQTVTQVEDQALGIGRLRGSSAEHLDPHTTDIAPLGKEQSNSSVVVDSRYLMKVMRRVEFVTAPELEMTRALRSQGFEHIAPTLASLEYVREGSAPALLALVQPYLRNGVEGWALALTSLRDLYASAEEGQLDSQGRLDAVSIQGGAFEPDAMRLGTVSGEMHLALSADDLPPDVRPVPLTEELLNRWADTMAADLDALLSRDDARLDPVRDGRNRLRTHFELLRGLSPRGLATRIHGDYHLGQLLRTDSGWTVLDFEGEPARPPEQRRVRSSPLRDVAGMLRSFDYAAAAALIERASPRDPLWEALVDQGDAWSLRNRQAYWEAYLRITSGTSLLPSADDALVMRRAFELQKAVYEVEYELGHRPDWVAIPLRFLTRLLQ